MKNPKLSIIIPVLHLTRPINLKRFFMPRHTIKDTLDNLPKNIIMDHEIVVVCNGQDEDLISFIKNHPSVTRYCTNSQNVGVARAWNMGAQLADGDVLCYLNDDVAVGPGALDHLASKLLADPEIGEIGPEGSYWKNCNHDRLVDSKEPVIADVVSGFCFLVRTNIFHDLGGFDIDFTPAGCEEIDLSYRIRQAGLKCIVDPTVDIKHYHHHGVSSQIVNINYMGKSIDTRTLNKVNMAHFKKKWDGIFE